MNMATFERAELARFGYEQARYTGALDCMKAVCYVIKNRVKSGWGDGTWLSVISAHSSVDGNSALSQAERFSLDPRDRLLQMLIRDIDDIYMGTSEDLTKSVVGDALYFQAVDLPAREWFVNHIARNHEEHKRIAQVGPFAFFL